MVWIVCVILMVLVGAVAIYATRKEAHYPVSYGWLVAWAAFGAIVLGPLVTTIFLTTTADRPARTSYIVNMGDTMGVSGRFFLGSGTIESGPAYFYYTGNGTDGFHAHSVDASGVTVKYDDEGPPRMECFAKDWRTSPKWILAPFPEWDDDWPECNYGVDEVVFYVPTGTVKQNYTLDAQ